MRHPLINIGFALSVCSVLRDYWLGVEVANDARLLEQVLRLVGRCVLDNAHGLRVLVLALMPEVAPLLEVDARDFKRHDNEVELGPGSGLKVGHNLCSFDLY